MSAAEASVVLGDKGSVMYVLEMVTKLRGPFTHTSFGYCRIAPTQ